MHKKAIAISLSLFLSGVLHGAGFEEVIQQGERLFESGDYLEASAYFQEALKNPSAATDKDLRYRLAITSFLADQNEQTIQVLTDSGRISPLELDPESLFLLGLAYQKLKQSEQAAAAFQRYLSMKEQPHTQEAFWELGLAYYRLEKWNEAKNSFEAISPTAQNKLLFPLSQLYLAKIEIHQQNPLAAEKRLQNFSTLVSSDHPLQYEADFLLGELSWQSHDYLKASEYFKKSLPKNNPKKAAWYPEALSSLAKSYIQLAQDSKESSQHYIQLAQEVCEEQLVHHPSEEAYLNLEQCLLILGKQFQNVAALQKLEELWKSQVLNSPAKRSQALLLQAKAALDEATRQQVNRQLLRDIKILLTLNTKESLKQSEDLLTKMIENNPDQDELFYLQGLVANRLAAPYKSERAWLEVTNRFPDSPWTSDSLYALGTLYFAKGDYPKAKNNFLELYKRYPTSNQAGDALFFASRAAENLHEPPEVIQSMRHDVWEKYPQSAHAAEAYLNTYSYADYMQGSSKVLQHLRDMPLQYPDSPFIIQAYYLMGLDYKKDHRAPEGTLLHKRQLPKAIESFQLAETAFDKLQANGTLPSDQLDTWIAIRYRAIIERAVANMAIAIESKGTKRQIYLEYAADVLNQLVDDFENPQHPLTKTLVCGETFHPLSEEGHFALAQVHLKSYDDRKAENILNDMLDKYKQAKITRGYFLSRTWYELGRIAMRQKDETRALDCFAKAEDASKGKVLSAEQKLDLWIQQSQCHRAQHRLDEAMLILSKVINEDAVSGQRLKAMFLRAEIYEEQGRDELAQKQLEALAKKGGEWGIKAKDKLEKNYGF